MIDLEYTESPESFDIRNFYLPPSPSKKRRKNHQVVTTKTTDAENSWDLMFERLQDYRNEQGDCRVPQRYKDDPQLGRWVHKQRCLYADARLDAYRRDRLESIGFVWNTRNTATSKEGSRWDNMFARLQAYKKNHGDCHVPYGYKDDPPLGRWVHIQRGRAITSERREKLESIGFDWNG